MRQWRCIWINYKDAYWGAALWLLIITVPVVQDLISVRWSDSIKTTMAVPARALYGQYVFEGEKTIGIFIQYAGIDTSLYGYQVGFSLLNENKSLILEIIWS